MRVKKNKSNPWALHVKNAVDIVRGGYNLKYRKYRGKYVQNLRQHEIALEQKLKEQEK